MSGRCRNDDGLTPHHPAEVGGRLCRPCGELERVKSPLSRRRLFGADDRFTEEAQEVTHPARASLQEVVRRAAAEGYSIRDIELALHYDVMEICLMEVLELGRKR